MGQGTCRHCHVKKANRARGLCSGCYRKFWAQYELVPMPGNRQGVTPDFNGQAPLPDEPTSAWPGGEEKMKVLVERARLRLALHHPDDPKIVCEGGVWARDGIREVHLQIGQLHVGSGRTTF